MARDDLADALLVEEFLGQRPIHESRGDLVGRIIAAQHALAPAMPNQRPAALVMLQAAFVVVFAVIGLISGRWIMQAPADYDVSGIFMICTDAFYL
ncbi:hypothetical protein SMD31_02115 [Dongia rigui]|uniref:Uncharacterized protein n=2 Tax=Dongia rigui TaxID=940149 RepID=A0ABU5DVS3_9PROT|nr:hypothetical protein [Dongia rigui]